MKIEIGQRFHDQTLIVSKKGELAPINSCGPHTVLAAAFSDKVLVDVLRFDENSSEFGIASRNEKFQEIYATISHTTFICKAKDGIS